MKLFVFFGLPGTGKTFAGDVASKYFGYHVYDGDTDLTEELRNAFKNNTAVTDDMRDVFFAKLAESVKKQALLYDDLIVCQTFIKEKYRIQFLMDFPNTEFVLIETRTPLREKRLFHRKTMQLERNYARKMVELFEKPLLFHHIIQNNDEGKEQVKTQLEKILL